MQAKPDLHSIAQVLDTCQVDENQDIAYYKELLRQKNEELILSEKRYEAAMEHTDIIIFDYIMETKRILQSKNAVHKYGLTLAFDNGPEQLVQAGIVHQKSVDEFRNVFHKIEDGEAYVKAIITLIDLGGHEVLNELFLTNIYDENGQPVRAVGVMTNITEISQLEREEQYRKAMTANKRLIFEVNLTKNMIEYLDPIWNNDINVSTQDDYETVISMICRERIHGDNIEEFRSFASKEHLITSLEQGKTQLEMQYRRKMNNGSYNWVQNTMNVIKDEITHDVKVRCYIHAIDKEKEKELDLLFKSEHDALTEMLNRRAAEQRINAFLSSPEGKSKRHAFLLFDIDLFKKINDNFGHSFGDAVLSQLSSKVKDAFRDDDLLARIGGDEFIVLMKNISTVETVQKKVQELCDSVRETYTQNGLQYHVSISVGIAIFKDHGDTYRQLYERSDSAMYAAKKSGGNHGLVYTKDMACGLLETKEIEPNRITESKSFEKNIAEYVFRILYESPDKDVAINSVLELVGKQFEVSRAYVFENSDDHLYTNNTFEWCNAGISPQKENLQSVPYSQLGNYKANFDELGVFNIPDVTKAHPDVQDVLKPQQISSMLQFAILKGEEFSGFIGFDQCNFLRIISNEELAQLRIIANILGVFLMEMRAISSNEASKDIALSIVNGLDSYAYVIDKEKHQLLFINDKTKIVAPDAQIGDFCYKAFWDRDRPCINCPMTGLDSQDMNSKCTMKIYNHTLDIYTKATACWINWVDSRRACLLDCVDITEYVRAYEE